MNNGFRTLIARDWKDAYPGWYRYSFTLDPNGSSISPVRAAYNYLKDISRRFGPFPKPHRPHERLKGISFQECPSALKGHVAAFAEDADALINLHFIFKELGETTTIAVVEGA
ncbi:MAG TPA: hypothetical protein DCP55_06485 [Chitinophagaceae bacterium]|nr:hypothetical protein [Chitinophagaceae bacterium]